MQPTTGCALYQYGDRLVVEQNIFANNTMPDASVFNPSTCADDVAGCMMYKQSPPSLLDTLIKMFMEIGSVPVGNQVNPTTNPKPQTPTSTRNPKLQS